MESQGKTYSDNNYWDKLRKAGDSSGKQRVELDGSNGEREFDVEILTAAKTKRVLDLGCGKGQFTIEIAGKAKEVVGVDFSREGIASAEQNLSRSKLKNVTFQQASADDLPFDDSQFDVVVSRRGPATATQQILAEAFRVLRKGGLLMEITIGEKDKENIKQIFGRGQNYLAGNVADSKKKMLEKAGFKIVKIEEYVATEVFKSMDDLLIRLRTAPIIPDFYEEKDRKYLLAVEQKCTTSRGVETPIHRITIVARK